MNSSQTSNPQVKLEDLDLETWLRWVHEGPCCSHPKDPEDLNKDGCGPSGHPKYLDNGSAFTTLN